MTPAINQRVLLASRPDGLPRPDNFRIVEEPCPVPAAGQLLLEILYLSLDPYMRGRIDDAKSYVEPVALGAVMEGGTVARVLVSRHPDYAVGDIVLSHSGWQRYALSDRAGLRKLDPAAAPPSTALGVLGMPGFTAWAGLLQIGRPRPGETVVVAAASGAVGSAVGQIARIQGARAVGIAGGPDKCAFVRDALGFDAVVDHRAPDFAQQLARACPQGIDVYFENVGGKVWDAVFPLLNDFARVPVCGLIAQYNALPQAGPGADRLALLMGDVLKKSLNIRGFIQREFADLRPAFLQQAQEWVRDGRLRYREDIVEGLDKAPAAFIDLLQGRNFGKLIVQIA
ncbi:MAG: NADP-dependent oxidoreductase [Janthinobacterium lividum]